MYCVFDSTFSPNASWKHPESVYPVVRVIPAGGGSAGDRKSEKASFSSWKKVRVTNYSRHNMSSECIITLWTILMWLSLEKLPSLPLLWWIFPWLLNMKMAESPSSWGEKQTSKIWKRCFSYSCIQYSVVSAAWHDGICLKYLCICKNIIHQ